MELEQKRSQLISLIRAHSEEAYAASWLGGIDEDLYKVGGVWEIMGREIGWPLGYEGENGWVSWDEAAVRYGWATSEPWWVVRVVGGHCTLQAESITAARQKWNAHFREDQQDEPYKIDGPFGSPPDVLESE